jgi:alpha-N-arabinofuranosidase
MKKLYLFYPKKIGRIAPEIYGHFSEHIGGVFYDGLWVGKDSDIPNVKGFRKDIVDKLRAINPPVLRWPGGCFAERYDWRDGIGENRPVRPNFWIYKDGKYESNEVGTHEFMDLCEAIGAKAYFAANITSVPPMHILNWMDYCLTPRGESALALEREKNGHPEPFDIPFWGVGNENWGYGGFMRPESYADEFFRFAMLMNPGRDPKIKLFACGSDKDKYDWSHGVINGLARRSKQVNGFAMHYYCGSAGDPVAFTKEEWTQLLLKANKMDEIIRRNWNIICAHGTEDHIKLVVDEWGCWHPDGSGPSRGEFLFEQQNTIRDAMVAARTLNIFNSHCDKVIMANIAQVVYNLHSLFLAHGKDCIVTPTYWVFDMYKEHQGGECIETYVTENEDFASSLSVSASVKNGKTLITVANLSPDCDIELSLDAVDFALPARATARMIYGDDIHAHNTFDDPNAVAPRELTLDLTKPITVPRASILAISF